ncbi:MAG TPA: hypothetical protein VIV12_10345, partial [Streptosporangiaceae bacterium]
GRNLIHQTCLRISSLPGIPACQPFFARAPIMKSAESHQRKVAIAVAFRDDAAWVAPTPEPPFCTPATAVPDPAAGAQIGVLPGRCLPMLAMPSRCRF